MSRSMLVRLLAVLVALLFAVPAGAAPIIAVEDAVAPSEPVARDFAADFAALLPKDAQEQRASRKTWADPRVGGWGGDPVASAASRAARGKGDKAGVHRPVVFVHGNTSDAEFWRSAGKTDGAVENVRARFLVPATHRATCGRSLTTVLRGTSRPTTST